MTKETTKRANNTMIKAMQHFSMDFFFTKNYSAKSEGTGKENKNESRGKSEREREN